MQAPVNGIIIARISLVESPITAVFSLAAAHMDVFTLL